MILKSALIAAVCTGVLALSGQALADDYRPDEYLALDLSKAVLSPKRLGPPAQFAPIPVQAKADRSGEAAEADHSRRAAPCPRPRKTRKAPHQSARRPGARHSHPDLALPLRRHLQLAVN